jgi:hypothetical protein
VVVTGSEGVMEEVKEVEGPWCILKSLLQSSVGALDIGCNELHIQCRVLSLN